MKTRYPHVALVLCTVLVFAGLLIMTSPKSTKAAGGAIVYQPLPSSLDALYPPIAPPPGTFLGGMLGMGTLFSGIVADLSVGNFANAETDFAQFKAQYIAVSNLVSQWKRDYPMRPVQDLENAFATQDPGR